MEAFKEELIAECDELFDRIMKMSEFIYDVNRNGEFKKLDRTQQLLLLAQHSAMDTLYSVLCTRIQTLLSEEELKEYQER